MRSIGKLPLTKSKFFLKSRFTNFLCVFNSYRGRIHRKSVPTRSVQQPPSCDGNTNPPTNELYDFTELENHSNQGTFDLEEAPIEGAGGTSSTSYNLRRKHTDLPPPSLISPREMSRDFNEPSQTTVAEIAVAPEEGVDGFPCRQCGRCFAKVKSRNAHMKSHAASAHSRQDQ